MFNKLKRKLILINMSLLTLVFVSIFSVIYFTTLSNLNRDIEMTLNNSIINTNTKPNPGKPKPHNTIVVAMNESNTIVHSFANQSIDTSELQQLVDMALDTNSNHNKFKYDDSVYAFLKEDFYDGSEIVFLDITNQLELMMQLLETFLLIGSMSLLVLLAISVYLTNKTIKPIKDTFNKQKQFIADASHELKTPLAIIKTNVSLLLENPDDTIKTQSKWVNYIGSQTDRMSTLINEMLSLAKLDVEKSKTSLLSINISKPIENMLLSFEAILFENDIELESHLSKNLTINGDTENIKKLFSILMDNASKHTNKHGKITVKLFEENNKIKLSIKNTGDGIAKEHLEKIFERFYRIDSSRARETGGYGLGLSIAKSIVEQHHGKIYAESIIDESTTFTVELPAIKHGN